MAIKIAAASPKTHVGNITKNADAIIHAIKRAEEDAADYLVLPELSLTGVTLGSLLSFEHIANECKYELERILDATRNVSVRTVVGLPDISDGVSRSKALLIEKGAVVAREYSNATKAPFGFLPNISHKPMDVNIISNSDVSIMFGNDIFEDFMPIPMGSIVLLPSPLNATAHSDRITLEALKRFSAINGCIAAYAAPGNGESMSKYLFDGICAITYNGNILACSDVIHGEGYVCVEVEPDYDASIVDADDPKYPDSYLSKDSELLRHECERIYDLQAYALIRRLTHIGGRGFIVGVSGGLDSALAFMAAVHAADMMGISRKRVVGVSMPGFGSSTRTRNNAMLLVEAMGCDYREISIKDACMQVFSDIGHSHEEYNVVFENTQARMRTLMLLGISNKEGLLDIGTGDLSELALGWTTFGGDHLAQYGVNSTIPKTVIRKIVEFVADTTPEAHGVLMDILNTPISPELLPLSNDGEIAQKTEQTVGNYELHDFFIYQYVVNRLNKEDIIKKAFFELDFPEDEIRRVYGIFEHRFRQHQFKRLCAPESANILISLASHDWDMGSDM